ncbi:MAG: CPBP family intramembrane glutamic endopeptidase [Thermoplasmatota archaeon]
MASRRTLAAIILVVPFLYIYGLGLLSLFFDADDAYITPSVLLISLILNLLVMAGSVMLATKALYGGGIRDVLHHMYLRRKNALASVIVGVAVALLFLLGLVAVLTLMQQLGYDVDNELSSAIADAMTPWLLLAVPVLSAVSEELFFRGFIQMRLAAWRGQALAIPVSALLFGVAHLAYRHPVQVFAPFAFGAVLGVLMMRYRNVAAPMAAHFTFNFVQLTAVYLF